MRDNCGSIAHLNKKRGIENGREGLDDDGDPDTVGETERRRQGDVSGEDPVPPE